VGPRRRYLKWRNWLNFLGLHTRYRLTRLRSRYLEASDELTKPSSIHPLSKTRITRSGDTSTNTDSAPRGQHGLWERCFSGFGENAVFAFMSDLWIHRQESRSEK